MSRSKKGRARPRFREQARRRGTSCKQVDTTRVSSEATPAGARIVYRAEGLDPAVVAAALAAEATDLVSAGDRNWFEANTGRNYRLRPMSGPESALDPRHRPPAASGLVAYTLIKQLVRGVRAKVFFTADPFHRPENFSDNACSALFDEINARAADVKDFVKTVTAVVGGT